MLPTGDAKIFVAELEPRRHAPLTLGATPASFGPAPEHWLDLMDFDGGAEPLELHPHPEMSMN